MPAGGKSLDRLLSRAGLCSRTDAQAWIRAGRVTVNGRVLRDPEAWVDIVRDKVVVDGELLRARPKEVWVMHKPVGYVTTTDDEHGRETVYSLLPAELTWLAPIGRLDLDSSGLLLFTNDSDLAAGITDPKSKLPKVYEVRCKGPLPDAALQQLRDGVQLQDGMTMPARIDRLEDDDRSTRLRIEIVEGRNRQIRRMLMAVGSRVQTLHRVRIGPLELGEHPEGASRRLSPEETAALRAAVNERRAANSSQDAARRRSH